MSPKGCANAQSSVTQPAHSVVLRPCCALLDAYRRHLCPRVCVWLVLTLALSGAHARGSARMINLLLQRQCLSVQQPQRGRHVCTAGSSSSRTQQGSCRWRPGLNAGLCRMTHTCAWAGRRGAGSGLLAPLDNATTRHNVRLSAHIGGPQGWRNYFMWHACTSTIASLRSHLRAQFDP